MFHKGSKHSTQGGKNSMEGLNVSQRVQIFHGGSNYSTEGVKNFTKGLNIAERV